MNTLKNSHLYLIMVFLAAIISSCTNAPKSDEATVGEEKSVEPTAGGTMVLLDTDKSKIEWIGTQITGRHNGIISISDGMINIKDGMLSGGKFTINMPSLTATDEKLSDEKNLKLSNHLKGPDFFDVENYPQSTFEITDVHIINEGNIASDEDVFEEMDSYRVSNPTHTISGNLNMKGIVKSISFPAKIEMDNNFLKGIAQFNIDRSKWNVNYKGAPDNIISEKIHLGISIQSAHM